jgi:carbon storage regulator
MLVLSRKEGERILLGDNIVITLVRCAGGKARIGIEAPQECKIIREELVGRLPNPRPEKGSARAAGRRKLSPSGV